MSYAAPIEDCTQIEGLDQGWGGEPEFGQVVGEHIRWLAAWHQFAFFHQCGDIDPLVPPMGFSRLCAHARTANMAEQIAVERLSIAHEHLHRLARLVLLKAAAGKGSPSPADYHAVMALFEEFLSDVRRVDQAFATAKAGLDPLTGLRSRRDMLEDLAREYNRFARGGKTFCVAIGDIDHFKRVNDTYNHDGGDRVLEAVASCITRSIRSFDEGYRMGGEEFLICLVGASLAEGVGVIERLRKDVEATTVVLQHRPISVSASFGVAECRPGQSIPDLVAAADTALYRAKNAGRNRVEVAIS